MIITSMKEISLKSSLVEVLRGFGKTSFTVDELTQTYLSHPSSLQTSKKAARQYVYRNMQRLMKSGYMERVMTDGRWPHYFTSPLFVDLINESSTPNTNDVELPSGEEPIALKSDLLAGLRERLKVHQAEVLTAMGEMEEYDLICKEMPDLREITQPRYNESRERCSRLLGRVKALESLLALEAG